MGTALALVVSLTFVLLALWHFFMAVTPKKGRSGVVPSNAGKPLFLPSVKATIAVAVSMLLFAGLVLATAGLIGVGLSEPVLSCFSYALAFGLLVRGVGDFKYVGLFKRVRESRFACLDTLIYSPLCLLLATGVALVARQRG